MKSKYTVGLVLILLFISAGILRAQQQITPSSVNVGELSDSQVDRVIREMQARGLTEDQAVALARSQGATEDQISQMLDRIHQRQASQGSVITTGVVPSQGVGTIYQPMVSVKAPFRATEKNRKIFGFNIFNSENLTFEPSVNIPMPEEYTLGLGDQVEITVWGASQSYLKLTIDKNGSVTIPDIGPVYLSGLTFGKAQVLIKSRLMAIYSGMAGQHPNTWAEVSLGGLRSIKVNVLGEINAPGTYTLPSTASAFNALYLSGGPNENGSFREIRLIRDGETFRTIDVYDFLVNANPESNVQLRDQDILFVPPSREMVQIGGPVKRSGYFEIKPTETLKDLIRFSGGFTEKAYRGMLTVVRNNYREREVRDVKEQDFGIFSLQNGDSVRVDSILNRFSNRVIISGAVMHPGDYELTPGMKLSDLIQKADGLREDAFMNRGLISRLKEDHTPENLSFDVKDVIGGKNDIELRKDDQVTVRSIFEMREAQRVNIVGEVQRPESFEYKENMTLGDIIFLAGGFREDADISYVELSRRLSYKEMSRVTDKINEIHQFSLTRDLKLSPADAAFRLQPFDEVYVRRAPGFRDQGTVMVTGEVTYAGSYSISSKNERISDIIRRAGGLVPGAYKEGATLIRTREFSPVELEKRRQMMKDSLLTDSISGNRVSYSVGIKMEKILADPGNELDLFVKPGDVINIPMLTQVVKVSGSVLNPLALTWENRMSLREYIHRAGGYASDAKKSKVYVIYANGTSASSKGFLFRTMPRVTPGSEIIVPEKPEKKRDDNTMKWLSLAGLMSSLAVSVVTLSNLVK